MIADLLGLESIADLTGRLVAIPSVNPQIAPEEAHGEAAVASFARGWLADHGVPARLEEAAPGRPNVVGELVASAAARRGGSSAPTLVLCAHLDTVGTAGMTIPPFEPAIRDGRLYGRGSYDMKGAAAAVMCAAASLATAPRDVRVLVALVADEEYASAGAEDFVRRHKADACILTEPSSGDLVLAHRGFVWAEMVTRGRAVHGSRWDLGDSAVGRMGRIVAGLERFDRDVLRARTHALVGPASLHCAEIHGGVGWSTYAPECRLRVERRTLPGETPQQVLEELAEVVRACGEEAAIHAVFDRPPLTVEPAASIARCVRAAAAAVTGAEPPDRGVAYWMDAAIFAAAGIPTVNLGPSGEGAHEPVEWVDLASVVTCARVLAASARTFASFV